jgi:hypothetical protein
MRVSLLFAMEAYSLTVRISPRLANVKPHSSTRFCMGQNAGDLPFERPTLFTLAVNLKTAKALGLAIPPTLLARGDPACVKTQWFIKLRLRHRRFSRS